MSCSENSWKGAKKGSTIGVIKGDAGSLDYSSYEARQDPCCILDARKRRGAL